MRKSFCSVLGMFALVFIFLCLISCGNLAKEPSLSSIYVSRMPSKIYYAYDDPLDLTGLEITACYSNGSEKVVDGWTSLPKPWSKLKSSGTVTIAIAYENKITDFTITVVAEGEEIPEQPKDSIYTSGSEAAKVISGLTKAGDNVICVMGNVSNDDFSNINKALKSVAVGITLDFSGAFFTKIPESAFNGCKMLKGIVIPACVSSIGNYAFNECSGLSKLTIEDADEPITLGVKGYKTQKFLTYYSGEGLFYDCPLENLYLGRNIEYADYNDKQYDADFFTYGFSAFAYIRSPTLSVEIGPRITRIPRNIFLGCGSLNSITINSSGNITVIEDYAFKECTGLSEIIIPSTVTTIGGNVFEECTKLTKIVIPEKVTYIGSCTFNGCKRLESIILEDGEETLVLGYNTYDANSSKSKGLFRDCPLETLYLGRNIEYESYNVKSSDAPFYAYGYSAFAYIKSSALSVEIGPKVTSITTNTFTCCESITVININPSAQISSIGNAAFNGCKNLSSFIIPSTVNHIGANAFSSCEKLKEITIPGNVTYIGYGAFNDCLRLEKLRFEDGTAPITLDCDWYNSSGTGNGLFFDCPLESVYLGRNIEYAGYNDKDPSAPFKTRGYSAFANISTLNTVTINVPNGVSSFLLGKYAFRGCTGITSATFTPSTNWYNSSSSSMSGGSSVDVSSESSAASVLKSMGENYLYWKE